MGNSLPKNKVKAKEEGREVGVGGGGEGEEIDNWKTSFKQLDAGVPDTLPTRSQYVPILLKHFYVDFLYPTTTKNPDQDSWFYWTIWDFLMPPLTGSWKTSLIKAV